MSITHFKGNRSPSLVDTITIDGAAVDLTGCTVRLKARFEDSDTLKVNTVATITQTGTDPPGFTNKGGVQYDWADLDVNTAGELVAWWETTFVSGKTQDSPEFELVIVDHAAAAVTPTALVTVQAARQFVLRDPDDHREDQKLAASIASFSRAVAAYTRREWRPRSTDVTRRFWYPGVGMVRLAPYDLRTLTSVTMFTDLPTASQRLLVAGTSTVEGEYRLSPAGQTAEGTYRAIRVGASLCVPSAYPSLGGFEVAVRGDWGICATLADVPEDVRLACLIAVKVDYVNPEGFAARAIGELSITEALEPQADLDAGVTSLPPEARALLTPYKSGNSRFVYA